MARSCPYHAAVKHLALLDEHFGPPGELDDIPLFPTASGEHVEKERLAEVTDAVAARTGEAIKDDNGDNKFGNHSWRSAGAVYLSGLGVEIFVIQLLARWACALVVHYTRLAPLKAIATDFGRALATKRQVHSTKEENMSMAEATQQLKGQLTPLSG